MHTVVVLATGGTIATRADAAGTSVARAGGAELVAGLPVPPGVEVRVEDVLRINSFLMTLPRMHEVARRVQAHLEEGAAGVVVTHGTDTLEETAMLLDLVVDDPRPVVLTGAQRPADAPDSDGPRNLADAVAVAASPAARALGTLVSFDGTVFPARGTRKERTLASSAFTGTALGWVRDGAVHVAGGAPRRNRVDPGRLRLDDVRVDVVACYPGADATALRACVAAGAQGIVLEATGAGNATPALCEAVAEVSAAGVVVVTSTRVAEGPVAAIYGDGGGADLLAAGAVPSGLLRPPQARVLLAVLLGSRTGPGTVREDFATWAGG